MLFRAVPKVWFLLLGREAELLPERLESFCSFPGHLSLFIYEGIVISVMNHGFPVEAFEFIRISA